jgi:urea transporter
VTVIQVLGYVGSIMAVGTALVPENVNENVHGILSMTNIEFLGVAAALSGLFLYRQPGFWRATAVVGIATEVAALVFGFLLHTFWLEWLTFGLLIVYVFLIGLSGRRPIADAPRADSRVARITLASPPR